MIPLIVLGGLLVPAVSRASMTGLVSINGGTAVTAQQSDTSVNVPVSISGSDSFNGFSIQIHADTSFLSGASVSLAGSVLPNPTILGECINGVLIAGNGCPTQDPGRRPAHPSPSTLAVRPPAPALPTVSSSTWEQLPIPRQTSPLPSQTWLTLQ